MISNLEHNLQSERHHSYGFDSGDYYSSVECNPGGKKNKRERGPVCIKPTPQSARPIRKTYISTYHLIRLLTGTAERLICTTRAHTHNEMFFKRPSASVPLEKTSNPEPYLGIGGRSLMTVRPSVQTCSTRLQRGSNVESALAYQTTDRPLRSQEKLKRGHIRHSAARTVLVSMIVFCLSITVVHTNPQFARYLYCKRRIGQKKTSNLRVFSIDNALGPARHTSISAL